MWMVAFEVDNYLKGEGGSDGPSCQNYLICLNKDLHKKVDGIVAVYNV